MLNLDKTDIKDGVLIIQNEDNSFTFTPEERATEEQKAIIEEFKAVFPNGKPQPEIEISLDEVKQNKINELSNKCNETITNGFYSDADGTNKLYDFELENQVNLSAYKNNILLSRVLGTPIETISYYAKGETCHDYTCDQFLKLVNDGEVFKATNIVKYKDILKPMVEACETVEEVNAISWNTEIAQ